MRRLVLSVVLALAAPMAFAAKPTDAQVERLMEVMHTRYQLETILGQAAGMQETMIRESLGNRTLSDDEQAKVKRLTAITVKVTRDTMQWEKVGPLFRTLYIETFDAEDVDAMIAFYASPAGQRMLEKTPVLAQKTMEVVTKLMTPMRDQLQAELAKEFGEDAPADAPAAD